MKAFQLLVEVKYQAVKIQPIYVTGSAGTVTKVATKATEDGRVLSPSEVVFRIGNAQNACKPIGYSTYKTKTDIHTYEIGYM